MDIYDELLPKWRNEAEKSKIMSVILEAAYGIGIALKVVCKACRGTGLYQGMAEKDDCAVICYKCEGTGAVIIHEEVFTGRRRREGISRVFLAGFGYVHAGHDVVGEEGKEYHFSRFGCTYEEWLAGVKPKPMEELYCPYIFDNRGIGHEPFKECRDRKAFSGQISNCPHYCDKAECWKRFNNGEAFKDVEK